MPTKTRPCNSYDIIDSRDVIEAIEALESELEDEPGHLLTSDEADELRAELDALKSLADEASGYAADWEYGETLIRDSYFETYAQELADDIGAVDANAPWPMSCIDWEQAARELQQDYTCVSFDGVDYWIR